jgi:hypothetical protein
MATLPRTIWLVSAPADETAFADFNLIVPSLEISYSACKNVKIERTYDTAGIGGFTITGRRADETADFKEFVPCREHLLYNEPVHV